jgi:hypothetical protein
MTTEAKSGDYADAGLKVWCAILAAWASLSSTRIATSARSTSSRTVLLLIPFPPVSRLLLSQLLTSFAAVIEEVVRKLEEIRCQDIPELDMEKKLVLFYELRHSFGRTALLLSGGATLGMRPH